MPTQKKLKDLTAPRPRRYIAIGVLVVIVAIAAYAGYHATHRASAAPTARKVAAEQVSVASVESLSPENAPLSVIGEVTSLDQAIILSQAAGEITSLDVKIGDQVYAGETIASLENSGQQAAVTQAQGAYDAADAALVKASGGTQGGSPAGALTDSQSASDTQATLAAVLESAYASLDDAVHTKADTLFNYPRSVNPTLVQPFNAIQFYVVGNNPLVQTIENERQTDEGILIHDQELSLATSSSDQDADIGIMTSDAQTIGMFLNNLAEAVNQLEAVNDESGGSILPSATIASYQTTVAAARTEVAAAITSLTGTLDIYDTSGDQAQVEEALGALEAAKSALAKTYITSPISGTIVDLPITLGDYVSSGNEVAEVSNPGALKIVAHVSSTDAHTLSVGNQAIANGTTKGTIAEISPAIDPQTGTIEVDVALTGDLGGLVDGDSVTVDLDRTPASILSAGGQAGAGATGAGADGSSDSGQSIIPIVALKITPTGPEVFTVDPVKNVLVPHPVSIGSILGENIVVTQGLTPDLMIVTDARGLVAGENVSIKEQ